MLWVNTNRILHRQSVQSTNIQSGVVRFVSTDCKARKIIALKSDNQKQMENAHPCHRLAGKSQEEQSPERDPSQVAASPYVGSRGATARLQPFQSHSWIAFTCTPVAQVIRGSDCDSTVPIQPLTMLHWKWLSCTNVCMFTWGKIMM